VATTDAAVLSSAVDALPQIAAEETVVASSSEDSAALHAFLGAPIQSTSDEQDDLFTVVADQHAADQQAVPDPGAVTNYFAQLADEMYDLGD
jgi:hypothetical protein